MYNDSYYYRCMELYNNKGINCNMYSDNFDSSKGKCEYPLSPWECMWDDDAEAEPCEICPYFKKKEK